MRTVTKYLIITGFQLILVSCNSNNQTHQMGTYGFDSAFFEKHNIGFLELKSNDGMSRVLVVPAFQGRVMTSSAGGADGLSYGWINHSFIESGRVDPQFNVYGGEERFWLGPEGGPYSIYFEPGAAQVYENWRVPPVIDTDPFQIEQHDDRRVKFSKEAVLRNASGTKFRIGIRRTVSLLGKEEAASLFQIDHPGQVKLVAYQTENVLINMGDEPWTRENGLLSIWLLSMFNPSPGTIVFIPYNQDAEGVVVNDEYFGKVPADRLIADSSMVYFRIDGKYRSKIGIPPGRAKPLCGSFDPENSVLTLLWCSLPDEPQGYVNSSWGEQDDPYSGDVINSYNDGPVEDGTIMGPFYEIETSSPAAALKPRASITHTQRIAHIEGEKEELDRIVRALFGIELREIENKFK